MLISNIHGNINDGNVYYEQFNTHIGVLKPGDFVYVKNDGQNQVVQIDKIWVNKQYVFFFM